MCAIIGWNGRISARLLRNFLRNAESSGPMSTGMMGSDGTNITTWKKAVPASYVVRNHNRRVNKLSTLPMGVCHTRYATHGSVCDKNAHPFSDGDVHYVHNGVIQNYRAIRPSAVVDSQCLGPLIVERNISRAVGSVGLSWFELQEGVWKMFVYKHSQSLVAMKVTTRDENGQWAEAVVVASRQHHFPADDIFNCMEIPFSSGVAYEVTPNGLVEAWRNPAEAQAFHRATHTASGCYIGG